MTILFFRKNVAIILQNGVNNQLPSNNKIFKGKKKWKRRMKETSKHTCYCILLTVFVWVTVFIRRHICEGMFTHNSRWCFDVVHCNIFAKCATAVLPTTKPLMQMLQTFHSSFTIAYFPLWQNKSRERRHEQKKNSEPTTQFIDGQNDFKCFDSVYEFQTHLLMNTHIK